MLNLRGERLSSKLEIRGVEIWTAEPFDLESRGRPRADAAWRRSPWACLEGRSPVPFVARLDLRGLDVFDPGSVPIWAERFPETVDLDERAAAGLFALLQGHCSWDVRQLDSHEGGKIILDWWTRQQRWEAGRREEEEEIVMAGRPAARPAKAARESPRFATSRKRVFRYD